LTAGRIPNGAVIERELSYDLYNRKMAKLSLKEPSFENSVAIENAINKYFRKKIATAIDPKTVTLQKPDNLSMVQFLAIVENIKINYKVKSKIIINERTGTVVSGVDIQIAPVVITHGKITIKISPVDIVPETNQNTYKFDNDLAIDKTGARILTRKNQNTLANVTRSLKKLGAKPEDIISIIQAMKQAGAIQADLEII